MPVTSLAQVPPHRCTPRNELVIGEVSSTKDGGLVYDDPFFRRWVQVNVLEDIGRNAPLLLSD
jgi:hypothetical protein